MRRRTFDLLVLVAACVAALVIVAAVGARKAADGRTTAAVPASGGRAAESEAVAARSKPMTVELDDLTAPRPEPIESGRNPFGLQPRVEPTATRVPERAGVAPAAGGTPRPTATTPSLQTVPPISLKFIGIVNAPGSAGKVAVLTDGRAVFHGREGDIIEGRYRILRIGVESMELEHLDGRGRQTIRLSG